MCMLLSQMVLPGLRSKLRNSLAWPGSARHREAGQRSDRGQTGDGDIACLSVLMIKVKNRTPNGDGT
ncbi:unnamed protein product [Lota lota]